MRQEPETFRRPLEPRVVTIQQLAALLKLPVNKLERLVLDAPTLYTSFDVPKPNGTKRTIRPPKPVLREVQRTLLDTLQGCIRYPRWMMGSVPKRSIFEHAKPHVGRKMVATFDVKAFYPSTTPAMVRPVLERLGLGDAAADAVLRLVTKGGQLPQGGPASGFLANLALEPADRRIDALCRKHGLAFTRYVDDIAISGETDLRRFKGVIVDAVGSCGYKLDEEKTKFMDRDKQQIVTNILVNTKLRPVTPDKTRPRRKDEVLPKSARKVKADIWRCLQEGPATVAAERGVQLHNLKNSLTGKVSHIRGADAAEGEKLRGMLCGVSWTKPEVAPSGDASTTRYHALAELPE